MNAEDQRLKRERWERELDITINQRLQQQFTEREGGGGGAERVRRSIVVVKDDISSFARFLSQQLCLEVLLFWKEVEQFKGLFSQEERAALFSKIYTLYCEPGALWQVNFKGQHFKEIEEAMKGGGSDGNVDDDVFDATAQGV